jgi:alcohol dehydrogenase (NADP+)
MEPELSHPFYEFVSKKELADAEAWVWLNKDDYKRVFFKFPELEETDVRINIIWTGMCRSDLLHVTGQWGEVLYPVAPGHEIIGQVSHVGSKANKFKVGDTVGVGPMRSCCHECVLCTNGRSNVCPNVDDRFLYGIYFGGYATAVQVGQDHVFTIPEGMNIKESAPLLCAGVTCFVPLQDYAKATSKVAIAGIGGLGHLGLKYANHMGCNVTAISTSKSVPASRVEEIKKMGAETVISLEELPKHQDEFDLIILTSPDTPRETFDMLLEALAHQGTLAYVGMGDANVGQKLNPFILVSMERKIVGHVVGSSEDQEAMLRFSHRNKIISQNEHFSWEDLGKAFEYLRTGRPQFRCVVDVGSYSKANGLWK